MIETGREEDNMHKREVMSVDEDLKFAEQAMSNSLRSMRNSLDDRAGSVRNSIESLTHAIETYEKLLRSNDERLTTVRDLGTAYGLRAIVRQEAKTFFNDEVGSEVITEDIGSAIENWLKITSRVSFTFVNSIFLLSNLAAILAIMGCTKYSKKIGKLMFTFCTWQGWPTKKFAQFVWGARISSHALCVSPVDEEFLTDIPNQDFNSIRSWSEWLSESELSLTGFKLKMPRCELDELDKALKLLKNHNGSNEKFSAAYLYTILCERLVSSGRLSEALLCAEDAFNLYKKLLGKHFIYELADSSEKEEETSGRYDFNISSIKVRDPTWSSLLHPGSSQETAETGACYYSSWTVLQCYIESCNQLAVVYDMLGEREKTADSISLGESVAGLLGFSLFRVAFSSMSDKLNHKSHDQTKRETDVEKRKKTEIKTWEYDQHFSCEKCKSLQRASMNHINGDKELQADPSSIEVGVYYEKARSQLDELGWECKELNMESLDDQMKLRWAFARRRIFAEILNKIGKLKGIKGDISEQYRKSQQSTYILLDGSFTEIAVLQPHVLIQDTNEKLLWDNFAIDYAAVLYSLCLASLRWFYTDQESSSNSRLPHLEMVVPWLRKAFVLCEEVSGLFQKVSRLLVMIYTVHPLKKLCPLPQTNISESMWGSYFHQTSMATYLNHRFFYQDNKRRHKVANQASFTFTSGIHRKPYKRVAPSLSLEEDWEEYVHRFFRKRLPRRATFLCVSLIEDDHKELLEQFLGRKQPIFGWLIVSRLRSKCEPVVALLPIREIFKANLPEELVDDPLWDADVLIQKVAPAFQQLIQSHPPESRIVNRSVRKHWKMIDDKLNEFLKHLETKWFGEWKVLLEGQSEGNRYEEEELRHEEMPLKPLESASHRCIIGSLSQSSEAREMLNSYENIDARKDPMILLLDTQVQMLPWEYLPTLKRQEVYRLPNIASFHRLRKKNKGRLDATLKFPKLNFRRAFYLVFPDPKDASQLGWAYSHFAEKIQDDDWESRLGEEIAPAERERFAQEMSNYDAFWHHGHGDGSNDIPVAQVQRLEQCPAMFLCGCNSGFLSWFGDYNPEGAALDYIIAGSPFTVGHLWDGTERHCQKFFKFIEDFTSDPCERSKSKRRKMSADVTHPRIGDILARHRCPEGDKLIAGQLASAASIVCYGLPTICQTQRSAKRKRFVSEH